MKKGTVLLLVLLAALLVALGFLPGLAGAVQDAGLEKEYSTRPLHSITPYIGGEDSGLELTEKLTVLYESEISAIVPALASMTEQQLRSAVEACIRPYAEAGLLRWDGNLDFHANPYVAISWQDARRFFLFWTVNLAWSDSNGKYVFNIRMDDETGALLDMSYFDPEFLTDCFGQTGPNKVADGFAQVWLEQAGLLEQARPSFPGAEAQPFEEDPAGAPMVVYEITGGESDPIYIYFYAASHGEYMMWLEKDARRMLP